MRKDWGDGSGGGKGANRETNQKVNAVTQARDDNGLEVSGNGEMRSSCILDIR